MSAQAHGSKSFLETNRSVLGYQRASSFARSHLQQHMDELARGIWRDNYQRCNSMRPLNCVQNHEKPPWKVAGMTGVTQNHFVLLGAFLLKR